MRAALIAMTAAACVFADELSQQSKQEELRKSEGCISAKCHVGIEPMHASAAVRLGCTDCHGGRADTADIKVAHVQPRYGWTSSANPVRFYTLLNRESYDWVRFVNPGDLRVAQQSCGESGCHAAILYRVSRSMMTHGAFLWGAGLYNNGAYPLKDPAFGESYDSRGRAQRLIAAVSPEQTPATGQLPSLLPLPRFEFTQPGNVLRVFERGDGRLSNRGFGTLNRTDPVFQGLQRTRLVDPLLFFLGTNDHGGDYRSSGCTACHVIYANDRDPVHSAQYAKHGKEGRSASADPTISKSESGHPIRHSFTRSIPSSQCVVCHVHPGASYASQYLGYMWWDNETDGEHMYPREAKSMEPEDAARSLARNAEAASLKGLWSDTKFLKNVVDLNPKLKRTQFADFNGHGWVYRAVFKHDRKGTLLDAENKAVDFNDPDKFKKAVHLKDIHLERGMHCADCHFEQDSHGDGNLYGEPRAATEIECIDCHGGVRAKATLRTSGAAARKPGADLTLLRTPFGTRRLEWTNGRLIQRSVVTEDKEWTVPQVIDSVTPGHARYSEKSRLAKTIQRDGATWGDPASNGLAHREERMSCYACHTSWMTSCFGCHLSMKANANRPNLHFEGQPDTRNFTTYNFQVLRDDVFMLGKDSTVKNGRIAPVRSSSAVLVSSQNQNREWLYQQQQTVSAEGYNGQAFNPHFPHTVRTRETRTCTDCHVSDRNDNNAWMAQLLLQGTNFVNFIGRYVYVGEGSHGLEGVVVAERDEPQAVIGSELHKLAYPDRFAEFAKRRELNEAHHHSGNIESLQLRGEYLYAAKGKNGVQVYDVANIDNKAFAERIVTAPVSPLGQRLSVKTQDAAWIASPATMAVDPARLQNPVNEEQPIHPLYGYLYVADRKEGLILIGSATLLDGDPRNNFLKRAVTFNPGGALDGASFVVLAGSIAYVSCSRGVVVVSLETPTEPKVLATIELKGAAHIAVQFRYAFVCSGEGLTILDVTDPARPVVKSSVKIDDARDVYIARTYAYVAAGKQGVALIDVENPEKPGAPKFYNAGGVIDDAYAVKVGMTNASVFAYVADGRNGLRVLQLAGPASTPGIYGFSPEPNPLLIATYTTKGPAIALSKGLDRDRAVDETGNQIAVFGRRGARPFNREEMQRLYLRNGKLYTVGNEPPSPAVGGKP
jgi:hypothetical protein